MGGHMTASAMDRAASKTDFEGGMGIDATVPFGYESDFARPIYPIDKVNPKHFFSDDDLANVAGRMKGWVHSLARSGR